MTAPLPPRRETISIGPLSMAIEVAVFDAWLTTARPGATIDYAEGPALPRGMGVVALAREMSQAGQVYLKQEKSPRGWRFIAERASRKGSAGQDTVTDHVSADVLRILMRAAALGVDCPTNGAIVRELGLKDVDAARYQIRKLIKAGLVRIEDCGPRCPRIVTICATGAQSRVVVDGELRGRGLGNE
jgi:hypothetical protein